MVPLALLTAWLAVSLAPMGSWSWPRVAGACAVAAHAAMLTSLAVAFTVGRLTDVRLSRWLVAGIALAGTRGLLVGVATRSGTEAETRTWGLVIDLALAVVVLGLVIGVRVAPGTSGAGLAGVAGVSLMALAHTVRGPEAGWLPVAAGTAVALLVLAVAVSVAATALRSWAPAEARWLLAAGALLLATQRVVTDVPTSPALAWDVVALVAAVLGGLLMCASSVELVRVQVAAARGIDRPTDAVAALRADARSARAQLHEVRATVAGVLSASHLLEEEELPESARRQLTHLLHEETARLQRMLEARPVAPTSFDLDEAIGPVILARQAAGQVIEWEPSGLQVFARRDDVAQVVSVLLDNSASHAPGATVEVRTMLHRGWLVLRVSDDGPGVPGDIEDRLFDWGVRGPGSGGSGIGLHVAARLVSESNGYVHLGPRAVGAAFVVCLPHRP